MRQFFTTIPRNWKTPPWSTAAAAGASSGPLILPLAKPIMATVTVFAFMGAWNDYMGPLIYLGEKSQYTFRLGCRCLSPTTAPNGGC